MVWDFCSSFSRSLHLFPFSLEDFENAICHKDSNLIVLIVETHSALLRLLIKDGGEYALALQKRKRKMKVGILLRFAINTYVYLNLFPLWPQILFIFFPCGTSLAHAP